MKQAAKNKELRKGIAIMLFSSLLTCTGQLCWKLSAGSHPLLWAFAGFALYGGGALLMIVALRFGDLSVLHPMLSAGYILSILFGRIVLKESIQPTKLAGIALIMAGLVFISRAGEKK